MYDKISIKMLTVRETIGSESPKGFSYTPLNTFREKIWHKCANAEFKEVESSFPVHLSPIK